MTTRLLKIGSEIFNNKFKIYNAEALDILQHLFKVNKINDHTLHFVAKFFGQLDLKRFSKAVNASIDAFILIRCEYNESKGHPYWKDRGYTADDIIEVVEAYITGSIKYNTYVQLAISTFDNKITLSINLYGTKADQNKISSFLDRFINELQDII